MRKLVKPPLLRPGAAIRIIAPASPVEEARLGKGCDALARLGYAPRWDPRVLAQEGYFAGSAAERVAVLAAALADPSSDAIFCARGGYGSGYLLEDVAAWRAGASKTPSRRRGRSANRKRPPAGSSAKSKIFLGYSDITLLEILFWQEFGWVTFYGPMVAAGFDAGAGKPGGYDAESFTRALTETKKGWSLDLQGESIFPGRGEGILLGGCLTMVEATLGTPWELETRGAILLLEDRGMRPFQVDRALLHLIHAGKFDGVQGLVLGEFPECEPAAGSASVRQVVERLAEPFGIPVVWGTPIGHTPRPMLTVPLGVRAFLRSAGRGQLEILEPAVAA